MSGRFFDPSLLALDNAVEEFWQDYKRKIANQGKGQLPIGSLRAGDDEGRGPQSSAFVPLTAGEDLSFSPRNEEEMRKLWADAHMKAHFPEEAQFAQDVETIRAANQRMMAAQPNKKFSWKVLGMLLLAFVLAMICAYLGLNGGEW